ncbi:MAG: DUF3179 domain-containing protein [Chloroflexi bacterium]|nr:DUF3179 domain-containing protein [Chloroflexota bacterium]
MYAREIEGEEFTFGVSGKLIRNVMVMYDRQTRSYWSQLLGEAVEGELIGTKLEFLPSWMMTWEEWKNLHPETVALDKNGRIGGFDSYTNYYTSSSAGVIGEALSDARLETKEFIVGVELVDAAIAYPFGVLNDTPVVNDTVGDNHLLVLFDADSVATAVYNRVVDGQLLTFSGTLPIGIITDEETGSKWNAFTGEAIEGPLAGTVLTQVKSTTSFWFGWKDWHPDTLIYEPELE